MNRHTVHPFAMSAHRGRAVAALSALLAALALAAIPAGSQAASRSTCPRFTIQSGSPSFKAWDIHRNPRLTCRKVRVLLRGAYGRGAIRKVYTMHNPDGTPSGRSTYWLAGGWRCTNGAGGAVCWNAKHDAYNTLGSGDPMMAVTASTGY
jgi:hypothetical protein